VRKHARETPSRFPSGVPSRYCHTQSGGGSESAPRTVAEPEAIPFRVEQRSPRKDAQRNRERLVQAATEAFAAGADTVRLEDVAKAADVGIGTLYRNFPSREALVEEVYRSELSRLCAGAERLLRTREPVDALRTWLRRYQAFVRTKAGMAEALRAVIASGAITSTQTREQLSGAIGTLLSAGVAGGTMRADVRPEDVAASLAGVMLAAPSPAQATRMLDLLVEGVRTR
jgi:AcrR family transcriptional regulator